MAKQIIAVVGATGAQGGGLVRAMLEDGTFEARALTRDPSKPNALELKRLGADVVRFDLDDPLTHQAALRGVHGVFLVTNFWESLSAAKEQEQAKAMVASCVAAGVQHIVWSTLEDSRPFFNSQAGPKPPAVQGDMFVPHIDGKGGVDMLFPSDKTTFFHASSYLENLWREPMTLCTDGVVAVNMADAPLPVIAKEDVGRCALGVFKAGDRYKGQAVYVAGEVLPMADIMAAVSKATGKTFTCQAVSSEEYAARSPFFQARANMFQYISSNPMWAKARDPDGAVGSKQLYPGVQSVEQWAAANKEMLLTRATVASH